MYLHSNNMWWFKKKEKEINDNYVVLDFRVRNLSVFISIYLINVLFKSPLIRRNLKIKCDIRGGSISFFIFSFNL